ncbi:Vsp/OspC family lipoprotein [Candidatus Borrelia fainii]|uniref:Vsp/OspC family lipoprotein n=1 Tax=Candidatus Borrelia fainii TaxID=2518322 RepID=UPI0024934A1D|nr:Vsp/OspC family lipoprotein [Candidatus Borrelia fainii]
MNLSKVSTDIKNAVDFAASVKEVRILVESIDKLAKAIGQKIQANGLAGEADHNGSLIAGAYNIVLFAETKLGDLEQTVGLPNELKAKVTDSKSKAKAFLDKLKGGHADLGKKDATDDNAKKAIDKDNGEKTKGASDLIALNTAIGALVDAADDAVKSAMAGLTTPKADKSE